MIRYGMLQSKDKQGLTLTQVGPTLVWCVGHDVKGENRVWRIACRFTGRGKEGGGPPGKGEGGRRTSWEGGRRAEDLLGRG